MPKTDEALDVKDAAALAVLPTHDSLVEYVNALVAGREEDPDQIAIEIEERILRATTLAEVFSPQGTVEAESVLGVPLYVESVKWMPSDHKEGLGVYVILEAIRTDTREKAAVSCGARNVVVQMAKAHSMEGFPLVVKILQSKRETKAGFRPLWCELVDDDF